MKKTYKFLAVVLILTLILSFSCVITAFAGTPSCHVSMDIKMESGEAVDFDNIKAGDRFVVKLSTEETQAYVFTAGIQFDKEKLECVSIEGRDMTLIPSSGINDTDFFGLKVKDGGATPYVEMDNYSVLPAIGVEDPNENGKVGFEYHGGDASSEKVFEGGWQFASVTFEVKASAGQFNISLYEDSDSTVATSNVKINDYSPQSFTNKAISSMRVSGITADTEASGSSPYIIVDAALSASTEVSSLSITVDTPTWTNKDGNAVTAFTESPEVYTATMSLTVTSDTYRFSPDTKITMDGATTEVTDVVTEVVEGENNDTSTISFTAAYSIGGVTVSGTVTSYGPADGIVTIRLLNKSDSTEVSKTTTTTGTYALNSIPAGEYVLEVSKANHVTMRQEVILGSVAVTQDEEIWLIGDANCDGTIDPSDMQRIYSHLNGSYPLGSNLLSHGDVNCDGTIDPSDMQRIYSHLNGSYPLF